MAGCHSVLVADRLNPVCSFVGAVAIGSKEVSVNILFPCASLVARVDADEVHHVHILLGSQHLGQTVDIAPTHVAVVAHLDLTSLTLLSGHEDHTIGSSRTVDGAGCSVLQHVNTLDVGRVQVVDVTTGHTVDNVQRLRVTIGTSTTDRHLKAVTRLARYGLDGYTRALALKSAENLSGVQLCDVFTLYLNSSTSDQLLLLDTVTYDNHFVEQSVVFLKSDVVSTLVTNLDFLSLKADVRNNNRSTGIHVEREVTVEIGYNTVRGTFFCYTGSDDRALSVDYSTCNLLRCLLHVLYGVSGIGFGRVAKSQQGECTHHQRCLSKVLIHT